MNLCSIHSIYPVYWFIPVDLFVIALIVFDSCNIFRLMAATFGRFGSFMAYFGCLGLYQGIKIYIYVILLLMVVFW